MPDPVDTSAGRPAAQSAAAKAAAILAACAIAAPLTIAAEGLVKHAAPDPVGIPTACYGHTAGVALGQTYTDAQCLALLTQDLAQHGSDIDRCITRAIPVKVRAAFTDFAFNVGVTRFCTSTMARKANAGDLAGACAELPKWTLAGGKQLPGLVRRRAAEKALCDAGTAEAP